jgi:hypothetical protein
MTRFVPRLLALIVLAGLLPACGNDHGGPPPPPPASTLFFEGWDSAITPGDPGSQWTGFLATGGAILAGGIDTTGNPFLFLRCLDRGEGISTISTTALTTVDAPELTLSADMAMSHQDEGIGSFVLSAAGAEARADFDALLGHVAVSITIGGATTDAVFVPSTPFGPFHHVDFSVDAAGNASWSVDGSLLPVTTGPWPASSVAITLSATYTGSGFSPGPQFDFDNILATTP